MIKELIFELGNGLLLKWILVLLFIILLRKVVTLIEGEWKRGVKAFKKLKKWIKKNKRLFLRRLANVCLSISCLSFGFCLLFSGFRVVRSVKRTWDNANSKPTIIYSYGPEIGVTKGRISLLEQAKQKQSKTFISMQKVLHTIKKDQYLLYKMAQSNAVNIRAITETKKSKGWF